MDALRVLFAGGGTGGHLFPAIALADEIRETVPGAGIMFVGTGKKLEARVVPAAGYMFRTIWISGFHRSLRPGNLLFPLKLVVSMMQARSILRSFKPDVVVGTGGYVSGPVLRMAVMLGIPALIQEQNSYPGVTTRVLAPRVDEVHLTFESSIKHFQRKDNLFVSGNPTRGSLASADRKSALAFFGFDPGSDARTILVVGGSLGARTINAAVAQWLPSAKAKGYRLIWQTGIEGAAAASAAAAGIPGDRLWTGAFIDRMDYAYAAADLVVCRAGATTIAELTRLGKPALLVPYPFAAANHQVENAKALAAAGAADVVDDAAIGAKFGEAVTALLESGRLKSMANSSLRFGKPDAARTIAGRIIGLARGHRSRMEN